MEEEEITVFHSDKGLQRVADVKSPAVRELLQKDRVTKEEVESLSKEERDEFWSTVNALFSEFKGTNYDNLCKRIEGLVTEHSRRNLWEMNHQKILTELDDYIKCNGTVPSVTALAEKAGLSRKTVTEHLESFDLSKYFGVQKKKTLLIAEQIKAKLCQSALKGDTKAARLFFEINGMMPDRRATKTVNILQINNTFIDIATIQSLPSEDKQKIECVIREVLENNKSREIDSITR